MSYHDIQSHTGADVDIAGATLKEEDITPIEHTFMQLLDIHRTISVTTSRAVSHPHEVAPGAVHSLLKRQGDLIGDLMSLSMGKEREYEDQLEAKNKRIEWLEDQLSIRDDKALLLQELATNLKHLLTLPGVDS